MPNDLTWQSLLENISSQTNDPDEFLFEVGLVQNKQLIEIDNLFGLLKKDMFNKEIHKKFEKVIKQITGTAVRFKVINDYNAMTLFEYNWKSALQSFVVVRFDTDFSNNLNLYKINEYVDKINIYFGDDLIKDLSRRELTAVFLHELGHTYYLPSGMRTVIPFLLRYFSRPITFFTLLYKGFYRFLVVSCILMIITRGVTFLDHLEEHRADRFATKYGYGDELLKVLKKFTKLRKNRNSSIIDKIFEQIGVLITTYITMTNTHPSDDARAEKIISDIKNKYIQLYPQYKEPLINNFKQLNLIEEK